MSTLKVNLVYDGINEQEAIGLLERRLQGLDGVQLEQIGIGEARLDYDQNAVTRKDLEEAVAEAGGSVRRIDRLE